MHFLLEAWSSLADVHGTHPTILHELTRLNLLADWAETITTPVGGAFPGQNQLEICFQNELRRVELMRLARQAHDPELLDPLLKLLMPYRYANSLFRAKTTAECGPIQF